MDELELDRLPGVDRGRRWEAERAGAGRAVGPGREHPQHVPGELPGHLVRQHAQHLLRPHRPEDVKWKKKKGKKRKRRELVPPSETAMHQSALR